MGRRFFRHLINDGDIQVAVQDDRQCPRDGCGTHDKDMGRPAFLRQSLSLAYSEPVLLVRHDQRQISVFYLLLDQGMVPIMIEELPSSMDS